MTITLPGLILFIVIAAVCGAIGRAIAGDVRGGLIVSIALGFIGALLGPWIALQLKLREPLVVHINGHPFPPRGGGVGGGGGGGPGGGGRGRGGRGS